MIGWFEGKPSPHPIPPPPVVELKLKNDLPAFESANNPGRTFWEKIPFNPLPISPSSVIDWRAFKRAIDEVSSDMTPSQRELAAKVVSDLGVGADTLVDTSRVRNYPKQTNDSGVGDFVRRPIGYDGEKAPH